MAEDTLKLTVSNTGHWNKQAPRDNGKESHGLTTLKQRLRNHYHNHFQFFVEEKNGWIHVNLEINHILNSNYVESLQRTHSG